MMETKLRVIAQLAGGMLGLLYTIRFLLCALGWWGYIGSNKETLEKHAGIVRTWPVEINFILAFLSWALIYVTL